MTIGILTIVFFTSFLLYTEKYFNNVRCYLNKTKENNYKLLRRWHIFGLVIAIKDVTHCLILKIFIENKYVPYLSNWMLIFTREIAFQLV